ncbi:hypothetical protein L6452_27724 [Arctium lappa]|uniref:Uncharacterized protein n=1 Tax=Arctium lappa TaxID=4217 RepID=A0ACB8ZX81_ARCLA|nr:hypothetical protein L6452_27724 [Arctium lappa]
MRRKEDFGVRHSLGDSARDCDACHNRGAKSRAWGRSWLRQNLSQTLFTSFEDLKVEIHVWGPRSLLLLDARWKSRFWEACVEELEWMSSEGFGWDLRFGDPGVELDRVWQGAIIGLRIVMSCMAWELGPFYEELSLSLAQGHIKIRYLGVDRVARNRKLPRAARMIMYGTFIMVPGQCYGEPTYYMCILELPWYDDCEDVGKMEECSPIMLSADQIHA